MYQYHNKPSRTEPPVNGRIYNGVGWTARQSNSSAVYTAVLMTRIRKFVDLVCDGAGEREGGGRVARLLHPELHQLEARNPKPWAHLWYIAQLYHYL